MKKIVSTWLLFSSALALVLSIVAFSQAADTSPPQPSADQGNASARLGPRALGPFAIFDTNHDGVISADEIAASSAVLAKLDKNGDGTLTTDELPPPPACLRPDVADQADCPPQDQDDARPSH